MAITNRKLMGVLAFGIGATAVLTLGPAAMTLGKALLWSGLLSFTGLAIMAVSDDNKPSRPRAQNTTVIAGEPEPVIFSYWRPSTWRYSRSYYQQPVHNTVIVEQPRPTLYQPPVQPTIQVQQPISPMSKPPVQPTIIVQQPQTLNTQPTLPQTSKPPVQHTSSTFVPKDTVNTNTATQVQHTGSTFVPNTTLTTPVKPVQTPVVQSPPVISTTTPSIQHTKSEFKPKDTKGGNKKPSVEHVSSKFVPINNTITSNAIPITPLFQQKTATPVQAKPTSTTNTNTNINGNTVTHLGSTFVPVNELAVNPLTKTTLVSTRFVAKK